MKRIALFFAIALLPVLLSAQVTYTIDSIAVGPTYTLKKTETLPNGQVNVIFEQGEYDTTSLVDLLFVRTLEAYRDAANQYIDFIRANNEAKELRGLLETFVDTSYTAGTQELYAQSYVAKGDLPNFRLRVGGTFYDAKGYIAGNNLFRIELTDSAGNFLQVRDNAVAYFLSNKSIRLQPLDVINETVILYQERDSNERRTFFGEMQDGTPVRLTWLKLR